MGEGVPQKWNFFRRLEFSYQVSQVKVMRVFADDDARSSVNSLNIQCKNVKQVDLCPNIR
uniref:HDC12109 n=1 Tax=Drosophila melanogaster TaxID=7227 RepID=Q6IKM4_DROME|nr:TPA_inf: HDC12109 [Drosophila melanogaster]